MWHAAPELRAEREWEAYCHAVLECSLRLSTHAMTVVDERFDLRRRHR
jgi:hypothetical protein